MKKTHRSQGPLQTGEYANPQSALNFFYGYRFSYLRFSAFY